MFRMLLYSVTVSVLHNVDSSIYMYKSFFVTWSFPKPSWQISGLFILRQLTYKGLQYMGGIEII